jgi:PAS domain S-box-containing protein
MPELTPRPISPGLRMPEEHFRLMVEAVRDYAIFMLDPDGYIVSWNIGAERLKGYQAEEIIGRHVSTFYTPEDRERDHPRDELRQALKEGRYEEEGWRVRKDGTRFWANVMITAIVDPSGRHVGFTKVTRDFTERKAAEETLRRSEERFRLLIESVRDYAIFLLDPDGRISSWNSGAEHIKGYKADEIIGKHFSVFYPPEDAAAGRPEEELRVARSEGRYEEEGWRLRKNGERFWANVVLTAIYDAGGKVRGFAKVTRDLTERRRMEKDAREVARRMEEERERAREAELAISLRDDFIAIAAHELRTPLTALHLKLQGMRLAAASSAAAPASESLAKLTERLDGTGRHVQRLNDLVERLLDVARIVKGGLQMEPAELDLAVVVAEVVEDLREHALGNGSEIRLTAERTIGNWDRSRVEQVVLNLLSNAIKYGAQKPIDVRLAGTPDAAILTVTDRGIGIPAEDLERIFGRFERVVGDRDFSGLGIGLYIARHIVDAHGGVIHVSSAPGQGSVFTVELPRRLASPERR